MIVGRSLDFYLSNAESDNDRRRTLLGSIISGWGGRHPEKGSPTEVALELNGPKKENSGVLTG